jgi:hypothetical protein
MFVVPSIQQLLMGMYEASEFLRLRLSKFHACLFLGRCLAVTCSALTVTRFSFRGSCSRLWRCSGSVRERSSISRSPFGSYDHHDMIRTLNEGEARE